MRMLLLLVGLELLSVQAYGLIVLNDDAFFNKSVPDLETNLTPEDFMRANYVMYDENFSTAENSDLTYNPNLFEGDIRGVSMEDIQEVVAIANDGSALNSAAANLFNGQLDNQIQFNAVRSRYRIWPTTEIPFSISTQYSSLSKSRIASAMNEYGKRTCVKFIPRNEERDYLHITPDDGCYSMVGRSRGRQIVSLGSGCVRKGIIIHELMHTVGFFHEQSRADRDEHIDINYSNIIPGMTGQFQKYSLRTITHLGEPYDYGSVMHYSAKAFSKNGKETISPKVSGARIGQRFGFSSVDVNKINKLYQCSEPGGLVTRSPTTASTLRPFSFTFSTFKPTTSTPQPTSSGGCEDTRFDCDFLARNGWCERNKDWSTEHCPKSCKFCDEVGPQRPSAPECLDVNPFCSAWARSLFCNGIFSDYMKQKCRKSCDFC